MNVSRRQTLLGALAGFLKPLLPKQFPVPRFIRAPRFEIPFYTVSSAKFENTIVELCPMELPRTDLLERCMAAQFQEEADKDILAHLKPIGVKGMKFDEDLP